MNLEEFAVEVMASNILTPRQRKEIENALGTAPDIFREEFRVIQSIIVQGKSTSGKTLTSQLSKIRSKMEKYNAVNDLRNPDSQGICLSLAGNNGIATRAIRNIDRFGDDLVEHLTSFLVGRIAGKDVGLDEVDNIMKTNDRYLLKKLKNRDWTVLDDVRTIIANDLYLMWSDTDIMTNCCTVDRLETFSNKKYKIFCRVVSWILGVGDSVKSVDIQKLMPKRERYMSMIDDVCSTSPCSVKSVSKVRVLVCHSRTLSANEVRFVISTLNRVSSLNPLALRTLREILICEVDNRDNSILVEHLMKYSEADVNPKVNPQYLVASFSMMVLWVGLSVFGVNIHHLLSFVLLAFTTTPLTADLHLRYRSIYFLFINIIGMCIVILQTVHNQEGLMVVSWLCLMISWFSVCFSVMGNTLLQQHQMTMHLPLIRVLRT